MTTEPHLFWQTLMRLRSTLGFTPHLNFTTHAHRALKQGLVMVIGPGDDGFARVRFMEPRKQIDQGVAAATALPGKEGSANLA